MTADEFHAGPGTILDGAFPGEFTPGDERAYLFMLGDFPVERVMAALKAWRKTWRPAASELLAMMEPDRAGTPTFEELLVLLDSALYVHVRGRFADEAERAAAVRAERQRRLAEMHPLAAHFIDRHGRRFEGVSFHDEEDGKWRRKELREAWGAHCVAMEGRQLAALASGRGDGELGQLDPLAALGMERKALPSGDSA